MPVLRPINNTLRLTVRAPSSMLSGPNIHSAAIPETAATAKGYIAVADLTWSISRTVN